MTTIMRGLAALFAIALLSAGISACHDAGANPPSGPTQAQFDALVQRVADLEGQLSAINTGLVRIYASGNGAQKSASKASIPGTLVCGGSLGYTPADIPAWKMTAVYCKTESGYIVGLPVTDLAKTVQPVDVDGRILFETNDCSGTAYLHWSDAGALGLTNGLVFTYRDATGEHVGSIPPQESPINTRQFGSYMDRNGCFSSPFMQTNTVQIMPNDPETTKAQDSYTGPILIE